MQISAPGGSPVYKLAPDLTSFSSRNSVGYVSLTTVDTTGALTTLLSLTGKFVISLLQLALLTTNDIDSIRLTVDGVVIWDETGMSDNAVNNSLIGYTLADNWFQQFSCDDSLLLELECTADTSITFNYHVRPIL